MRNWRLILSSFLLVVWADCALLLSISQCSQQCTCYLDGRGRNTVLCRSGGLIGPLALNMSDDTEVLKITAPETNQNELQMSPIFMTYRRLEEVHITRSNIPQLGQHFFIYLDRLDVLDLSQNNITQPLDHNFRGLTRLQELRLDDNRISSLPSGTFRHLPELRVLSIQRNRITELTPHQFLENRKLKVLKLNGNYLQILNPAAFQDIQELKTLECRACGLNYLDPAVFDLLPELTELDVGSNFISVLRARNLTHLDGLKTLRLDGNRLSVIKNAPFAHLQELRSLDLNRNSIYKLSKDTFSQLTNLTDLNLGFNQLQMVPDGIFESFQTGLETLILSGNPWDLRKLAANLRTLEIRALKLADCGFLQIPSDEKIFPNSLLVLDLSRNLLSSMDPNQIPFDLMDLRLDHNQFRGLSEALLMRFDNLKVLNLDSNPWSCDLCHIVPLLDRVNRSADSLGHLKCQQPVIFSGHRLEQLQYGDLEWCTSTNPAVTPNYYLEGGGDAKLALIAAGTAILLLFLSLVTIGVAFCYSRRHMARYYTHEEKLADSDNDPGDTTSPLLFGHELNFKFQLNGGTALENQKLQVSTIDELCTRGRQHTTSFNVI